MAGFFRLLRALILLALLTALVAVVALVFTGLQQAPLDNMPAKSGNQLIDPGELQRMGKMLPNRILQIDLAEEELRQLAQQQLNRHQRGVDALVDIKLDPDLLSVRVSAALPLSLSRKFLNAQATIVNRGASKQLRLNNLQIGQIRVPQWLSERLVAMAALRCNEMSECLAARSTYNNVEDIRVQDGSLSIFYQLPREGLAGMETPEMQAEAARLMPYVQELLSYASEAASDELDLHQALRRSFALAQRQSLRNQNPVAENRAAILALAAIGADSRVTDLMQLSHLQAEIHAIGELQLRKRSDLAQHFLTSAALTLLAGTEISEYIGVNKELSDVAQGKRYDVADLMTNQAGIRFAELAIGSKTSARTLQSRMLNAASSDAYLLPNQELKRLAGLYQDLGDKNVQNLSDDIAKSLNQQPIFMP